MSMVFGMSEWVKLTDRIRELEAQLAEARNAALEEAAKEAHRYGPRGDEVASAIRALKTVTPP